MRGVTIAVAYVYALCALTAQVGARAGCVGVGGGGGWVKRRMCESPTPGGAGLVRAEIAHATPSTPRVCVRVAGASEPKF